MPWVNDTGEGLRTSGSGGRITRPFPSLAVDPFDRNRQERRLSVLFFSGMVAACALLLWLFHGPEVIRWLAAAGGGV